MLGPDVASVDGLGDPSWKRSIADGHMSFAILRAAYGTMADPMWGRYRAQLRALGILTTSYLFLRFPIVGDNSVPGPTDQAKAFLSVIGQPDPLEPPPAIDLEIPGGRKTTGLTSQQCLDWLRQAWNIVASAIGCAPILYTSRVFWMDPDGMDNLPAPDLAESPGWWKYTPYPQRTLAVYDPATVGSLIAPGCPPPWGQQWLAQQYQLDALGYPGLDATCDLNRFHTLSEGAAGDTVKWMQRRLGIADDGRFGPQTKAALVDFQKKWSLQPDGVFGWKTFGPLARSNP